jgi:lambda family phage portal protein
MTVPAKPRIRVSTAGQLRGAVVDGEVIRPKVGASYMRGGVSPFFFNWNPALRDQRDEVRLGYVEAAARAIDAAHNSGWIAGAVDQSIASTIGTGLRLAARPDREALGWTSGEADKWSETVERRWSTWSEAPLECDAAGKMTVAQMQDAVLRAYYSHGEALALMPDIRRPISLTRTKVQLLPPHRLVQDSNPAANMFQGVTSDSYGLPLSYRTKTKADGFTTADIRARDGAGRPQVAHLFEGREGQVRGITPIAPALRVVRQYDQLADATLQAALIQALFAATVEGDAPTEEILRALQSEEEQAEGEDGTGFDALMGAQAAWYQNSKIDLGGAGRVVHMFPGQKLTFNRSEHPNDTYEAFAKFLLREIARCLGMTFETMTGDYSAATYSSVRMATSEIWPIIQRRRQNICGRFTQIVYEAWLEEQIEQGFIPFPGGIFGFIAHRPEAVAANWRGPAKPQADDLKTAKAHEVYKRLGIMSDERIADDLGFDIGDEYERRAREKKLRDTLDLPDGDAMEPNDPIVNELLKEPA